MRFEIAILDGRGRVPHREAVRFQPRETPSMDGTFACPECGAKSRCRGWHRAGRSGAGSATGCWRFPICPGRPMPPGSAGGSQAKWVRWAWIAIAVISVVVVATGAVGFLKRQYESIQDRSIGQLFDSSRRHEAEGQLGEALIDLDTASSWPESRGLASCAGCETEQERRPDLARRDAEAVSGADSCDSEPCTFRSGDWLNLIARTTRDPDLASLSPGSMSSFRLGLERRRSTSNSTPPGPVVRVRKGLEASLTACDRIGRSARTSRRKLQARRRGARPRSS